MDLKCTRCVVKAAAAAKQDKSSPINKAEVMYNGTGYCITCLRFGIWKTGAVITDQEWEVLFES